MRRLALVLLALVLAGCVYYPTVEDIGGIRIRPQNGRAVVQPTGLALYMDLDSTGKYGDALVGVTTDVARGATIVTLPDQPVNRIEVPGATIVSLRRDGPHVLLSELTRAPQPGEVILVTLLFEKLGRIGVPTKIVIE